MTDKPNIFLKKIWEFNPKDWPILAYSRKGYIDKLIKGSKPHDLILFVATENSLQEGDEGRMIALAEFGRVLVNGLEFIGEKEADKNLSPHNFPNGKFKWPYAVKIKRAWMLTDRPLYSEVLEENKTEYNKYTRSDSYPLTPEDVDKVLALAMEEVPVGNVANRENITNENIISKSSAPSRGPTPYLGKKQGGEIKDGINYTYAFRFGSKAIWKIGYSQDLDKRLKDINTHIPYEILKEKWNIVLSQKWNSAEYAFAMEQEVLKLLHGKRSQGERVACSENEIETAWGKAVANCSER